MERRAEVLDELTALPAEAFPVKAGTGALEFYRWKFSLGEKPAWLVEFEENRSPSPSEQNELHDFLDKQTEYACLGGVPGFIPVSIGGHQCAHCGGCFDKDKSP